MKYIRKEQEDYFFTKFAKKALFHKKAKPFNNDFYDSLKTIYINEPFGIALRGQETSGKCYYYALLLTRCMEDSTLIIGSLNKLNSSRNDDYLDVFEHSWVEKDNLVYDTTSKLIFDKEYYYKIYDASVKKEIHYSDLLDSNTFKKLLENSKQYRHELEKPVKLILEKMNNTYKR